MAMDENKSILDSGLCEEDDGCMRLSLDDGIPADFDQLWDDTDEEELQVCASKKCVDKKKCIIIAAIAGVAIALTVFIIYKVVKNRKKNRTEE